MKSIMETINESKTIDTIKKTFINGDSSLLSMIFKRISKWDENSGRYSREPMFLVDYNLESLSWVRLDLLNTDIDSNNMNYDYYDGFLTEYLNKTSTQNNQYILGVFLDRCFIPIPDKTTFEEILKLLN